MENKSLAGERFLITGGLGYIGAHVAREFLASGSEVVILDNLATGLIERLPSQATFIECDVRDPKKVREICNEFKITGVVHMASFKHARESRLNPLMYLVNNVGATLGLVEGIIDTWVKKVIFSSSCSIYGSAENVDENSQPNPQSPYALSKLISEEILSESLRSSEISYTALRFFNVIGCADFPQSQDTSLECLIPVITERIKMDHPVDVLGSQLATPDGTCLRDYLDVRDIASAHTIVAAEMSRAQLPKIMNVSSGKPTSVREVIGIFEHLIGKDVAVRTQEKNLADPEAVWSQKSKILTEFGWDPCFKPVESIAAHLRQANLN